MGRYRLVERLGAGNASAVWRGYDEVLRRKVVRRRVPVVTDKHSQVVSSRSGAQPAAHDPFANAPVVADEIGAVVALPPDAAVPAAGPTTNV